MRIVKRGWKWRRKVKKIDPCRQRQTFRQLAKILVRAEYHNLSVANKRISKKIFFRSCFSKAKKIFLLVESDTFQSRRKAGGGGGGGVNEPRGNFASSSASEFFLEKSKIPSSSDRSAQRETAQKIRDLVGREKKKHRVTLGATKRRCCTQYCVAVQ